MTNEEANYKYDRAIDLIKRIKTEETHEREIDRHKAFDLAISALEKQIPKKPRKTRTEIVCPTCATLVGSSPYCRYCGQALDWGDSE